MSSTNKECAEHILQWVRGREQGMIGPWVWPTHECTSAQHQAFIKWRNAVWLPQEDHSLTNWMRMVQGYAEVLHQQEEA